MLLQTFQTENLAEYNMKLAVNPYNDKWNDSLVHLSFLYIYILATKLGDEKTVLKS